MMSALPYAAWIAGAAGTVTYLAVQEHRHVPPSPHPVAADTLARMRRALGDTLYWALVGAGWPAPALLLTTTWVIDVHDRRTA